MTKYEIIFRCDVEAKEEQEVVDILLEHLMLCVQQENVESFEIKEVENA
jgi:hypothetical protein